MPLRPFLILGLSDAAGRVLIGSNPRQLRCLLVLPFKKSALIGSCCLWGSRLSLSLFLLHPPPVIPLVKSN